MHAKHLSALCIEYGIFEWLAIIVVQLVATEVAMQKMC
jgi:hypothetical protein